MSADWPAAARARWQSRGADGYRDLRTSGDPSPRRTRQPVAAPSASAAAFLVGKERCEAATHNIGAATRQVVDALLSDTVMTDGGPPYGC